MPPPPPPSIDDENKPSTKDGTFWNGFKKILGLPFEEAEYFKNKDNVKSVREHGLWGLWTYDEKFYAPNGSLEEHREFKGNDEVLREQFHDNNILKRRMDIKDGHPVGQVQTFNEFKSVIAEENYNDAGKLDGLQRFYDDSVPLSPKLQKEVSYQNGQKHGKEQNFENGDFANYNNGTQFGAFQETIETQQGSSITKGHIDKDGSRHIQNFKELNATGDILKEIPYDKDGNIHGNMIHNSYPGENRITPYKHGQKDGVETWNTQNGKKNMQTWHDNQLDGPYQHVKNLPHHETEYEHGSFTNGQKKISQVERRDSLDHQTYSATYDNDGNLHGDLVDGDHITPYNHGVKHGRETEGSSFKTWENGKLNGPFQQNYTAVTNINENLPSFVLTGMSTGRYQNGQEVVDNEEYFKQVYDDKTGKMVSTPLTKEEFTKLSEQQAQEITERNTQTNGDDSKDKKSPLRETLSHASQEGAKQLNSGEKEIDVPHSNENAGGVAENAESLTPAIMQHIANVH